MYVRFSSSNTNEVRELAILFNDKVNLSLYVYLVPGILLLILSFTTTFQSVRLLILSLVKS